MLKFFFKRLFFSVFALFILMSIVFFLLSTLPNAPISRTGRESEEEFQIQLRIIGWNLPLIQRYGLYWKDFFSGTFGQVFNKSGISLVNYFFQNIPNTLYVASIAYFLAIFLGFTFGIISAIYRGKWQDTFINVLSVIFVSVPSFIIGILLLRLAGVIGLPQMFINFGTPFTTAKSFIASSFMPVISLTFSLASTLTYFVRNELVEVLNHDYIKVAYSKGLSKMQVIFYHGLRNSLIPALSVMAPSFLFVITGSIVLEQIFGVKGIALILFESILQNQFNLIMFQTFFISGLYFLIILLVDISYTLIDPRIKLSEGSKSLFIQSILSWIKRFIWKYDWNKVNSNEYFNLQQDSSLHDLLNEKKLINFKTKKVYLNNFLFDDYKILLDKKFLVIGKDIYKIEKEEKQTNGL